MMKTIIAVAGLGIAGAVFFLYTRGAYDEVRALQSQIGEYDQALQKAAELQELKQALLSRYNAFNPADLDRLRKLLPDHVDNVRLVLDLDSMASRHGMALQNVVISNPASETANEGAAVSVIGGGKQSYDSLTLKFSTLGSYENFTAFLEDLEASLRIVDLVSLSLTPESVSSEQTQNTDPLYKYEVTIRTYWLK